jgi:hypothetical protein
MIFLQNQRPHVFSLEMEQKKLHGNIQQNFQPQRAASLHPQTGNSVSHRPLGQIKHQLMQPQCHTSNMAASLQKQQEEQLATSWQKDQCEPFDQRRRMSVGITPPPASDDLFVNCENGFDSFGVEGRTLQTSNQITSLPSQLFGDRAATVGQLGAFFDSNVGFYNENASTNFEVNQNGRGNSTPGTVANNATDPALCQMGEQPYLTREPTKQYGMLHVDEAVKAPFTVHRNGQYDVFHPQPNATGGFFDPAGQFHQVQPQQMGLDAVPYLANQIYEALPQRAEPAQPDTLPDTAGHFHPAQSQCMGPYIELRNLHPADPRLNIQSAQSYASMTPAAAAPQQQQRVQQSSKKAVAQTQKPLMILSRPYRPYNSQDFAGCGTSGRKKEDGNWDVNTEQNHYEAFLKYHGRPALPAPVGRTPFTQRTDTIKSLSASDRKLLMDFVKAEKFWREYKELPNPPNVAYTSSEEEGYASRYEDESIDEEEHKSGSADKSGKQQMTASKKRSRDHEKMESTEVPAATQDTRPIKKIRTNQLPRETPYITQEAKTQQLMCNGKAKLAFGSLKAVDEHMAREGHPSLLELVNEHLASKGRRTIRLTCSLDTALPSSGSTTSSGADFNSPSEINVSTRHLESSCNSGTQSSNLRKRKARTDSEESGNTKTIGSAINKNRTGSAEMADVQEQSALPRRQTIQSKTQRASQKKQAVTETHSGNKHRQFSTAGPSTINDFTPVPINHGEQSDSVAMYHSQHGALDIRGQYYMPSTAVESTHFKHVGAFQPTHGERSNSYGSMSTPPYINWEGEYHPMAQETSGMVFPRASMERTDFLEVPTSLSQITGEAALEEGWGTQVANEVPSPNGFEDLNGFDFESFLHDYPSAPNDEEANHKFDFEDKLPKVQF